MPWTLDIARPAKKDLTDLAERDRLAIIQALDSLALDPGGVDLSKLAGRANQWRLRVGRWRVILDLDNAAGTIRVRRVLPRGRAYRD